MPQNWKTYKLKEITIKIGSGSTPRGGKEAYKDEGISLIRSQNVLDYSFSIGGLAFIDEDQAYALRNVIIESRDVLLNITGDSVARVCQVPDKWIPARVNQHVAILRADIEKLSPEFLKYSLLSKVNKDFLLTLASAGATRNALTKTMIEDFEITIPEINEQRAIASILSALDDKIELNLQMNKTLEEMAMALYKHWFVDFTPFKSPLEGGTGDVDSEFIDSELGKIPKGWEVKSLDDILKFKNQGVNTTTEKVKYSVSGTPVIRANNISKNYIDISNLVYVDDATYSKIRVQCKPEKNDILFTNIGSQLGNASISYFDFKYTIAWNVLRLKVNENLYTPELLVTFFNNPIKRKELQNLNSSSTMPFVSGKVLGQIKLIIPDIENLKKIGGFLESYYSQLTFNHKENQTLTKLRDTLLPKLISGEVRVKDALKQVNQVR